jgi:hypothetical protein
MTTKGSGRIDQSVPSAVVDQFKQLYSDHLLHEETRDFIRKVVLETLGHEDGIVKIKRYAKESVKEYSEEDRKERKNFWTPNGIGIIGIIVAIVAVLVAWFKP